MRAFMQVKPPETGDMREGAMPEQVPQCPECGSTETEQIYYGLPTSEFQKRIEAENLVHGGCVIFSNSPAWHCRGCENEWGSELDEEKKGGDEV